MRQIRVCDTRHNAPDHDPMPLGREELAGWETRPSPFACWLLLRLHWKHAYPAVGQSLLVASATFDLAHCERWSGSLFFWLRGQQAIKVNVPKSLKAA